MVSIVLPTYNEKDNVSLIVDKINQALKGIKHEIIIVDDNSPDGTYDIAKEISKTNKTIHPYKRTNDRGLSSAVVKGFHLARGDYLFVMDADMQHDENILPQLIDGLKNGSDVAIGSRKTKGGGIENWSLIRRFISWGATMLAKIVLPQGVSDPMSGYFGITQKYFQEIVDQINSRGFKILLEVLAVSKRKNIVEVGYVFKPRIHGESKLSGKVMLDCLLALYEIKFGKALPLRFFKYLLVGLSGIIVHGSTLYFLESANLLSQNLNVRALFALEASIISNFLLNNYFTFRASKLESSGLFWGLLKFQFVCAIGIAIHLAIMSFAGQTWSTHVEISDALLRKWKLIEYSPYLSGLFVSTLWNYIVNANFTWKPT